MRVSSCTYIGTPNPGIGDSFCSKVCHFECITASLDVKSADEVVYYLQRQLFLLYVIPGSLCRTISRWIEVEYQ